MGKLGMMGQGPDEGHELEITSGPEVPTGTISFDELTALNPGTVTWVETKYRGHDDQPLILRVTQTRDGRTEYQKFHSTPKGYEEGEERANLVTTGVNQSTKPYNPALEIARFFNDPKQITVVPDPEASRLTAQTTSKVNKATNS